MENATVNNKFDFLFDSDIVTINDKYPFDYNPHPTKKNEYSIAIRTHINGVDKIINDDQYGHKINQIGNAIMADSVTIGVNDEIKLAYVENPYEYEEVPDIDRNGLYSSAIYQIKGRTIYDNLISYRNIQPNSKHIRKIAKGPSSETLPVLMESNRFD